MCFLRERWAHRGIDQKINAKTFDTEEQSKQRNRGDWVIGQFGKRVIEKLESKPRAKPN